MDRLVWAVRGSYSIGGAAVGVRSTSKAFGEWLDGALRSYRGEGTPQPYYSVVIADPPGQGGLTKERYHILYKGTIAAIKTPDIHTLVTTLLSELEMFQFPERGDAIFADMNVVSRDGMNVLAPGALVPFIGTLGRRRLSRTGLTLPAEAAVAIDPDTARVIPLAPHLELAPGSLDELAAVVPADGREPRMVVESPIAVDALVSIGWGREPLVSVSKGLGLYRMGTHLVNLELLGAAALEGVRPLVESARCYEIASAKPAEMLDALLRVFPTA